MRPGLTPGPPQLPGGGRRLRRGGRGHEQVLLVPDEVVLAVHGQFVVLAHEDRRDRAGFLAVAAEDAACLVDLVDLGVTWARLHGTVVLRRLEVDGVGRARHRAEPAGHALLEPVLVSHQHLLAAVLREHRDLLVRVADGDGLAEEVLEGRRKPDRKLAKHRDLRQMTAPRYGAGR